jgi:aryl-alcohol dehydrogenase-like predicted oxidoreductase
VNYLPLGRTGMMVSPLCLGNMMFGAWGNADHDDATRIIHRALDHGINLVDTADVYSAGESEVITGQALAGSRRDGVILATKAHFPVDGGPFSTERAPNTWGNSRRHIVRACEESLRRLGTDWIDLYQIHRPDPDVPLEETLSALTDLVHQGKIRAFGCSTFPAEMIVEAEWIADRRGLMTFATEQPPYSIFVRGMERDLFPVAQRFNLGVLVWSPLNGSWLSGRYRKGQEVDYGVGRAARSPARFDPTDPVNQRKFDLVEDLVVLADKMGIKMTHLALAFALEHPAVTSAIIGPRTMEQLEDVLGAEEVRLPAEVLDRIDELVRPGTNVSPGERGWEPPHLAAASTRRRRGHAPVE